MKLLYKPLGIIFGVLGGTIFKQVWKRVSDEEDAPKATESEYDWERGASGGGSGVSPDLSERVREGDQEPLLTAGRQDN